MESPIKKKVLLVGTGSYIGTSFINLSKDLFDITQIDSMKPLTVDQYRGFDSVLHLAGIAHVSRKQSMKDLYYKVNRDLAIQSARLAKEAGVKQFLFMSSMIIYGGDQPTWKKTIITAETQPSPRDFYGDSKLQADLEIQKMADSSFSVVISRTPMVYGPNSKGNYPKLKTLALKLPVLPRYHNQRTVIGISTLIDFFQRVITNNEKGVFYPRDSETMDTFQVMLSARQEAGKKTLSTILFNPLLAFCSIFSNTLRKMFGSKVYDDSLPS